MVLLMLLYCSLALAVAFTLGEIVIYFLNRKSSRRKK